MFEVAIFGEYRKVGTVDGPEIETSDRSRKLTD